MGDGNEEQGFIEDLRLELLRIAIHVSIHSGNNSPNEVVQAAKVFEAYINGPIEEEKPEEENDERNNKLHH